MQENREQKPQKKTGINPGALIVLLLAVTISGIMIVSVIRQNSSKIYPSSRPSKTLNDAESWLNSVQKNNEKLAIIFARKMVDDDSPELPQADYMQLMLQNRLGTLILTSPFNKFDFLRWKDAVEIKKIVDNLKIGPEEDTVEALYKIMINKVKVKAAGEPNTALGVSILDIWNKKTASTQELCRLFSSLAQQAGYDVQVIKLLNESDKIMHVFCEVRTKNRSYIVDPRFGFVEENASAELYAGESSRLPKTWPQAVAGCINRRVYQLPAEPLDYKVTNQRLYAELKGLGLSSPPRFGIDPQSSIDKYIEKYQNKNKNNYFTYWNFPFNSLMSSPDFPQDWRIKIRK